MKMRTALALLADDDFSNYLKSFTLRCQDYGFDLRVLRLPAHVSLKQPFMVNDFERFEAYFEELATRIEPQVLKFDGFVFWGDTDQGVIAARVAASHHLRQLHEQLNTELEQLFGETQADFDGASYEFHLTVAIGKFNGQMLPQLQIDIAKWVLNEINLSSKLAMFIYKESPHPDPLFGAREYGVYKTLPLAHKHSLS